MTRSPLHCWAQYVDPNRAEEEPTPALRFGTLVHTRLLTPDTFGQAFAVADGVNRRTPAGRAQYAALRATGKPIVTTQDQQAAARIVEAIRRHAVAGALFQTGEAERIITVARPAPLLPLKGRVDWLTPPPALVELKTAADASREGFIRAVYRHGYHLSAAYYRMLVSRMTGTPEAAIPHTFVVAETRPPYAVAVYPTAERLLAEGRALGETALARFDDCWLNADWPGYAVESLEPAGGLGGGPRRAVEAGEVDL